MLFVGQQAPDVNEYPLKQLRAALALQVNANDCAHKTGNPFADR